MLTVGGLATPALGQAQAPQTFEGPVLGAKGNTIGTITIRGGAHGLLGRVSINAGGLAPEWHGIHFHQVRDCSDSGKFERSKGHVNPNGRQHGLLNPEGPDAGDPPNIYADEESMRFCGWPVRGAFQKVAATPIINITSYR